MSEPSSKSEYSGAALRSFIVALSESQATIDKLLADAGVDNIDPEAWYDYDWAVSFFYKIETLLGKAALTEVGRSMIEAAIYPPEIDNIHALLSGLGYWFALNARGPDVGEITCEFEDECTALIDNSARGPCSFNVGIIQGACARYGITPLIEHGNEGCKDDGAPTCLYRVSW
ncbi:hypothetical protein G6O69_11225 [Pseudenhygromyxa sp. WMMC2535]|uniref:hypothetical protein n=1 Tax=Pseudenhygromyxa sp. WMMC2535 TaxID=2712867 RepID=UPI0015535D6C|nr:hypothetical protein [Pseudenhygromyxa sp. WMMC2535]NVB38403.1 hypothetical protein [Pseudenhygromyxa sp. WMMC2535]